jgi:hypothetical protein
MSCISNSGYQQAEKLRSNAVNIVTIAKAAQLLGEAAINGQKLIDNYKKQYDLAKRAQAIAEAVQGQQSMFWGAEQQFKNEFTNPEPVEDVEVMGRRYSGRLVSSVLGAFAKKIYEAKCNMNRYCTSANQKALQDLYLMRSFAVSAARTLGRNIGFAEWQARNDLNWERRKQAAALGRKLTGDASSLIKSAGQGLAGIGAGYEDSLNSALKGLGYTLSRDGQEGRAAFGAEVYQSAGAAQTTYNSAGYINNNGYLTDDNNLLYGGNGGAMYSGDTYGTDAVAPMPNSIMNSYTAEETDITGFDQQATSTMSDSSTDTNPSLYNEGLNPTRVGPQDRVRTGKKTFYVQGGKGGFVEIDMERFDVGYADHLRTDKEARVEYTDNVWPT